MTLVIFSHPAHGHCYAILEEVEKLLKEKGETYEVLNLYKMKFNPVLPKEEHYTSVKAVLPEEIIKIQKKITENNKLIFIYPTWWGGMPAIMKGFFDRVLTSGFAFKYVNMIPRKLLTGKKALVITTSGAPGILNSLKITNKALMSVKYDILEWCGIKTKVFCFSNSTKFEENKGKIPAFVKKVLKSF